MPLQFFLDYTAPFQVGDEAYAAYPSTEQIAINQAPHSAGCKVIVSAVNVRLGTGPGGSLAVTELTDRKEIEVERVTYTLVPVENIFAAFTLDYSPQRDTLNLFHTQDELLTYHNKQDGNKIGTHINPLNARGNQEPALKKRLKQE